MTDSTTKLTKLTKLLDEYALSTIQEIAKSSKFTVYVPLERKEPYYNPIRIAHGVQLNSIECGSLNQETDLVDIMCAAIDQIDNREHLRLFSKDWETVYIKVRLHLKGRLVTRK